MNAVAAGDTRSSSTVTSNSGNYQLHVNAEVEAGAACTDPLFAAGVSTA
jgi:hypothetical protein